MRLPLTRGARFALGLGILSSILHAAPGGARSGRERGDAELPLQTTRVARFTVDEGTWISLDVSPDGRTIVFDLLGHLYTLPVEGGRATRLTSGLPFDAQPRFSPDGREITFTSDRDGWVNVWVAARDGTRPRQITHFRWGFGNPAAVSSPEWTPDGDAIVVSRLVSGPYDGTALTEYPLDGRPSIDVASVTSSRDAKARLDFRGVAFGQDPRTAYAAMKPVEFANGYWQIVGIDRRTGTWSQETSLLSGRNAMRPVVSPDGRYLVYSSVSDEGFGLRIRNLHDDREWWLVRRGQPSVADVRAGYHDSRDLLPGSSFTPDGRAFITSYDGKIWRIDIETGLVSAIPFVAEIERELGPLVRFEYPIDARLSVHAIRDPQISPDASRVVFSALDRLWIADLPGTDSSFTGVVPTRLTTFDTREFFPTWSPDGRYIVYSTWADENGGALWRVRANGSGAEKLTQEPGFYAKPLYSADGGTLIAVRGAAETFRQSAASWTRPAADAFEIVRMSSAGGPLRSFATYDVPDLQGFAWKTSTFVYGRPHLSHVRDWVNWYNRTGGLLSTALETSNRRMLLKEVSSQPTGRKKAAAMEVVLSPTGRHALALAPGSQAPYLIELPAICPDALVISLTDHVSNPPGVRIWPLSTTGADFLGWTSAGFPYFSAGPMLSIAKHPVEGAVDRPPLFRRVAIELTVPRDRAPGALMLRGARLVTMRGHEIIEQGDLLVRDGRIAALGPAGRLAVPEGARVLDVTGATILPGYIDVHDHVGHRVAYGTHMDQEPRLLTELAHGVTTLRDPLGYGLDLMAYGERAAAGDLVAPRIYTPSLAVSADPFGDGTGQELSATRDVLVLWSSDYYGSETIKQYLAGGRRTRQLIAMAARDLHLTPTNEGSDTAMTLTMAIDGYGAVEHPIPVRPQFNDVIQLLTQANTIMTPTFGILLNWRPFLRHDQIWTGPRMLRFMPPDAIAEIRQRFADSAGLNPPDDTAYVGELVRPIANLMKAGGCVAMGSHGNVPGVGAHMELWYLANAGVSNHDALRSATMCGAVAIGHARDLGSLEPGKLADLQVLDKNPLEEISYSLSIRYVMKDGRLYDATRLDELWPRQRSLPAAWWTRAPRTEQSPPGPE